jgi:hypothetical protein
MCQFLAKKSATAGNQNSHAVTLVAFLKAERVITPCTACKWPETVALSVSQYSCYPYKHTGKLATNRQAQEAHEKQDDEGQGVLQGP